MRRKRFNHHVDIFCQMFCGWRLSNCTDRLVELGSGCYEYDIISRIWKKDHDSLEALTIGEEISIWWREDMEKESIPLNSVSTAKLTVLLEIDRLEGKRKTNVVYPQNPHGDYFTFKIEASAILISDPDTYKSTKLDYEEWPYPLKN